MRNKKQKHNKINAVHARLNGVHMNGFNQSPSVRSVGNMILDPVWARKIHASGDNELIHVTRGDLLLKLGRRRLKVGPGETVIVPAGAKHRDDFDLSAGLEAFYVFFDWPPAEDYFRIVNAKDVPRLSRASAWEVEKAYDRIEASVISGGVVDQLLVEAYVHNILLLILREALRGDAERVKNVKKSHAQVLMLKAREYIDRHYAEEVSLDRVAESLQISPFYLSHLFSRQSELSFMEYLTDVRMRKARELLGAGEKNVSETAYVAGYQDSNYFSKVFRRHFGISPGAVRRGLSQKSKKTP